MRAASIFLGVWLILWGGAVCAAPVTSFTGVTVDDENFDLAPYIGKVPILLDFGSIYCSSCVQSIPDLVVLQSEYGVDKLKVVGVNLDTYGISRVKRFFATFRANLNFPILIDKSLSISKQFDILTLPTYVLIDKNGEIAARVEGWDADSKGRIERIVEKLVKGEALAVEEAPVGENVSLLLPENFTMTQQDKIFVVGKTGGREGPFTVRRNGGAEREVQIKKGMFVDRIPLSLGSNFIEVRYPKGEAMASLAVVLFREPRMGEGTGVNFPTYNFHVADKEARCQECHDMQPDELKESNPMMGTQFCQECHGYQIDQKFVHGPITVGGCGACHDFASEPHRYDLGATGTDLCFSCHADVQQQFELSNIHGPVAMGLCTVCHSPHGSPYRYQLREIQSTLCLGCHEDTKSKMDKFIQHRPVAESNCTGCHDPHSSDNDDNFLKGEGAELCSNCHSEQSMVRHTHPQSGFTKFWLPEMRMLPDGDVNCFSCHDPHSSDEKKLLLVPGGCNGCHDAERQIRPKMEGEEEEEEEE